MSVYKKILSFLSPREKRRGLLVLIMVIIMGVLETAGVASIMPFLSVLGSPERVQTNPLLSWGYESFGFDSLDEYLFASIKY